MRERPILFSSTMVRAILDGSKTQTRRGMKVQPLSYTGRKYIVPDDSPTAWRDCPDISELCPYGQPGDKLWVRETFADLRGAGFDTAFAYLADSSKKGYEDEESKRCRLDYGVKWKPSIHMPRWASRINLEITGIRVERLQDITNNDALAEGTPDLRTKENNWDMVRCYQELWEQINGKGSWALNPWVWVVEFKRLA